MDNTELKPKILLVDDKPQNLYALEKLLSQLEVQLVQTTSAFEVLKLTLKQDFCLAIIDVQMPEMDGYELVELLRGHKNTETLPVIFVSAIYSDEYHHRKGYDAGAVDFLSKPFNPDILLSKVKIFIDLYRQRVALQEMVNQLDEANKMLSKRAIEVETSNQVGQHATSILDIEKLLPEVVSLIQVMFHYYFVSVWLFNKEKEVVILRANQGDDGRSRFESGFALPLDTDKSIIVSVYHTRKYYLVNDVSLDTNYMAMAELPDTRSELTLPLQVGDQMLGVLDIQSKQLNAFGQDSLVILQTLANQIAIAIHNARLYSLEKNLRGLEAQRARELTELNASKDKFFSIVAHDLRSPFNPLLGMVQLMVEMPNTTPPQEFKEMGKDIYRSAQNVYNLLENLLEWSRLQQNHIEHKPERLMLKQTVKEIGRLLTEVAISKGVGLQNTVPDGVLVYADENMLNAVIRNLTSNALKFTTAGGMVSLSVQPSKTDSNLAEISVSDTGVGISPENLAKLFKLEVTHTTRGTAQEKGTGLGLIICQEMVEKNGGRIWIESDGIPGRGTTVKFTVPLAENLAEKWQTELTVVTEAETQDNETEPEIIITPPAPEMAVLYNLALRGNLLEIRKQAARIEQMDEKYNPFTDKLQQLAKAYADDEVLTLIKQYMEETIERDWEIGG